MTLSKVEKIIAAAGIGSLIISAGFAYVQNDFLGRTKSTIATVQRIDGRNATCTEQVRIKKNEYRTREYPCTQYTAVMQFVTDNGATELFQHEAGSVTEHNQPARNAYALFAVGEQVPILYDPANPDDAIIDHWGEKWGPTIIFGILGVGALLGAIFGSKLQERERS